MGRDGQPPVARPLAVAAAYAWRLLAVGAALYFVGVIFERLMLVVLPLFLSLFGAALLRSPSDWLRARGVPPAAAAFAVMVAGVGAAAGLLWLIVPPFVDQVEGLGRDLRAGIDDAGAWLREGPLHLSEEQLDDYIDRAERALRGNTDRIALGALTGARVALELVAGLLLAIVITFFFVKDGDRIAGWFVGLFPPERRDEAAEIGRRSWRTLSGYLRGVTVVALVDAVLIGLALWVLGVPAVLPLAVLTFFLAYIPIAGAVLAGLAAALVALVSEGVVTAALVVLAVLIVQQLEGNFLQPVVVGRAVSVHPVAILLAVTVGGILGGIAGAVVAVPVTAVAAQVLEHVRERSEAQRVEAMTQAAVEPVGERTG